MVNAGIIEFLKELQAHNNREWFEENRQWYETARKDFEHFIEMLIQEIRQVDNQVGPLTAKDCMFRIYRDVRFSKDKAPYKTNFGAYISRGGKKLNFAGYYFHIEPGEYFMSGGIYMPQGAVLKAVRNEIYNRIDEFMAILEAPVFKKLFGGLEEIEKMKTAPRDYPKDFPQVNLLKHKHYIVSRTLTEKQLTSASLLREARETYEAIVPLNHFLNNAIEDLQ